MPSKINCKIFDKLNNNFAKFISSNVKAENTLFVSLGARFIFKKDLIKNFFKHNLVNFHSSRLPLDRAGGGFSWRIMREDRIENHENL